MIEQPQVGSNLGTIRSVGQCLNDRKHEENTQFWKGYIVHGCKQEFTIVFFFQFVKEGLIMEVHPFTMNCLACLYECKGKAFALNPASAFGGGGHSVGFSKMLFILLSIFIPRQKGLGDTAMSIASVSCLSVCPSIFVLAM